MNYAPAKYSDRAPEEWLADELETEDFEDTGWRSPPHVICRFECGAFVELIHVQYPPEPEDATLERDFSWIYAALTAAYAAGAASR